MKHVLLKSFEKNHCDNSHTNDLFFVMAGTKVHKLFPHSRFYLEADIMDKGEIINFFLLFFWVQELY